MTEKNQAVWQEYYKKVLSHAHTPKTEMSVQLCESPLKVAVDCGCGTGGDIDYLEQQGYVVYGFDNHPDSIAICKKRFANRASIHLEESSFENYHYPRAGIVIANSSLFFADPSSFENTWEKLAQCIAIGGVFAGDFMGKADSWATHYRSPTTSLSACEAKKLFKNFEIIHWCERDEDGETALGRVKHWHTFSVIAIKRA